MHSAAAFMFGEILLGKTQYDTTQYVKEQPLHKSHGQHM